MFKPSRLSLAVAVSLAPGASWAVGDDQPQMLEPMEIIGDASAAQTLPGSGYVVGDQQLKTEVEADINQVLKTVPGVYVREEEGLGLRPNIGIRGATAERSSNVTLMEDGILIAPAPILTRPPIISRRSSACPRWKYSRVPRCCAMVRKPPAA